MPPEHRLGDRPSRRQGPHGRADRKERDALSAVRKGEGPSQIQIQSIAEDFKRPIFGSDRIHHPGRMEDPDIKGHLVRLMEGQTGQDPVASGQFCRRLILTPKDRWLMIARR